MPKNSTSLLVVRTSGHCRVWNVSLLLPITASSAGPNPKTLHVDQQRHLFFFFFFKHTFVLALDCHTSFAGAKSLPMNAMHLYLTFSNQGRQIKHLPAGRLYYKRYAWRKAVSVRPGRGVTTSSIKMKWIGINWATKPWLIDYTKRLTSWQATRVLIVIYMPTISTSILFSDDKSKTA